MAGAGDGGGGDEEGLPARKEKGAPMLTNNHRWDKVRKFEDRYKKKSLRRMSQKESLGIFLGLYQFGQELLDEKYYSTLDQVKIESLIRIHSLPRKGK